jgi:hypothetical protein
MYVDDMLYISELMVNSFIINLLELVVTSLAFQSLIVESNKYLLAPAFSSSSTLCLSPCQLLHKKLLNYMKS